MTLLFKEDLFTFAILEKEAWISGYLSNNLKNYKIIAEVGSEYRKRRGEGGVKDDSHFYEFDILTSRTKGLLAILYQIDFSLISPKGNLKAPFILLSGESVLKSNKNCILESSRPFEEIL